MIFCLLKQPATRLPVLKIRSPHCAASYSQWWMIWHQKLAKKLKNWKNCAKSIPIETSRLKETRDIQLSTDALDALIAEYAQKEKEFETKQRIAEETFAADMTKKRKDWEREQEEYGYKTKIERKKEEDACDNDQKSADGDKKPERSAHHRQSACADTSHNSD